MRMSELPTLGEQPKKSNPIAGVLITAVIVGLISGGVYWWKHQGALQTAVPAADTQPAVAAAAPPGAVPAAAPGQAPVQAPAAAPAPGAAPVAVAPAAPGSPAAQVPAGGAPAAVASADKGTLKAFTVHIHGPMESAIVDAVGKKVGTPLTQVVNRSLVWWLRVPQDLVKGDTLSAVYEERENQEPLVHAVRLVSSKLGKTLEAYRFKPDGAAYPRFYAPDGSELELRLVDGPLDDWEQITSLLKDGRHHKGVDFKTPMGTPVKATFDGTIVRKTWQFRGAGNSLDIEESGGQHRHAYFFHLQELPKTVAIGNKVKKGEVIAQSGNTGHSFAPHLHYQLMSAGGDLLDPFESHKTTRASVDPKSKPKLDAEVARLNKLLESSATASAGGR
jgi:murein DD-endopeptidase MepM/ murein hydrolase activator NlpD